MTNTKRQKPVAKEGTVFALLISFDEDKPGTGYGSFKNGNARFHITPIEWNQAEDKIYNILSGAPYSVPYLPDLLINTLGNNDAADYEYREGRDHHMFAHEVVYRQPYTVHADDAEAMAATFRRIQKSLERDQVRDGYWKSTGQYVARVARALDIEILVEARSDPWLSRKYRAMNPGEAVDRIDSIEREWQHRWRQKHTAELSPAEQELVAAVTA